MNGEVLTVVVSVLGSGVTAALIAARAQRRTQLRERMVSVASDFAATTMEVLAALRRYKPTKPGVSHHRNEPLFSDRELRAKRYDEVQHCFDALRGLRGRVRLHFPGIGAQRSTVTVQADAIVGALRQASDASEKFWKRCDADPQKRRQLEDRFSREYQDAREQTWERLNAFCNDAASAANHREQGPSLRDRLAHRLGRGESHRSADVASGANPAPLARRSAPA